MEPSQLDQAMSLFNSGSVEEALRQIRALAESTSDPNERVWALHYEAACLLNLGRFQEARQRWREAVEVYPKGYDLIPQLVYQDAVLCLHEKNAAEALQKLDCILTNHVEVLNTPGLRYLYEAVQTQRGITLTHLGRFQEASRALEQALTFPLPKELKCDAHYRLGVCYFQMGDMERAKEGFVVALENNAQGRWEIGAHYHLGIIFFRESAHTKALEEFEWCLGHAGKGWPPAHQIYGWLANTLHALGRGAEAKRYEALAAAAKYPQ
jgi:tetratricopeptide (TPR) repeat protein